MAMDVVDEEDWMSIQLLISAWNVGRYMMCRILQRSIRVEIKFSLLQQVISLLQSLVHTVHGTRYSHVSYECFVRHDLERIAI